MTNHAEKKAPPTTPWFCSATFWIILAGLIRLLYFAEQAGEAPWFTIPISDEAEISRKATALLAGEGFGKTPFFRSPLYTLYIALTMKMFGSQWIFFARLIQHLCGALLVGVAYKTASSILPKKKRYKWGACYTAALLCFYGPLIRLEHRLVLDFWVVFLQSTMLMLLISQHKKKHLWSGMLAALAWLTRPTLLVALPFIAGWILIQSKKKRALLHFLLPITVLIGGFTLSNGLRSGEYLPLPWQGGFNFYHGNHTGAHGRYFSTTHFSINQEENPTWELMCDPVKDQLGKKFTYAQVSPYWMDKTIEDIKNNPARWLGLMAKKTLYLLNAREIYNFEDYSVHRERSKILSTLPFNMGTLLPLALAALPLLWLTVRKEKLILLLGYGLFIGGGIALYYASGRMRMPIVFPLAVFAGSGISIALTHKLQRKQALLILTLLTTGLLISWGDWWGVRSEDLRAQEYTKLSQAAWRGQYFKEALSYAEKTLQINPNAPTGPQSQAQALFALGQIQRATTAFQESTRRLPDDPVAPFNLAYIQWVHHQNAKKSLQWVQYALKKDPLFQRAQWLQIRVLIALKKEVTPIPPPNTAKTTPFELLLTLAAQSNALQKPKQEALYLQQLQTQYGEEGAKLAKEEYDWMDRPYPLTSR